MKKPVKSGNIPCSGAACSTLFQGNLEIYLDIDTKTWLEVDFLIIGGFGGKKGVR